MELFALHILFTSMKYYIIIIYRIANICFKTCCKYNVQQGRCVFISTKACGSDFKLRAQNNNLEFVFYASLY